MARRWTSTSAGLLVGTLAAAVVLGPVLLRPGFVLTYDMVFVPDPPWSGRLLGLGSATARAVPSDLLVTALSSVLPAEVVQRMLLVAVFVVGGTGAARLLEPGRAAAGAVTALAYVWTATTYERLVLGQWALLLSVAALPWVVVGAARLRAGDRPTALVLAMVLAGCGSPAGALLAGATGVVVACWPGGAASARRRWGVSVAVALLVTVPWAVPSLLQPSGVPVDPSGFEAFAARADTRLGTLGSVLAGGGVWNARVAPPGRDSTLVALLLLSVLAAAVLGLRQGLRTSHRPVLLALLTVGGLGAVLAVAPLVPWLSAPLSAAAAALPGGGLLRDGQKFAAPLTLAVSLGLGHATCAALPRLPDRRAQRLAVPVLLLVPVALLPALAWGAAGRLQAVAYPTDWAVVRELVSGDPGPVAVLPWAAYRTPSWNDGRPVLDPSPRMLDVPVVVQDDLPLVGRTVSGEDPLAARLEPVVTGTGDLAGPLASAGVTWVLVARGEPGSDAVEERLSGAAARFEGRHLSLWRLEPAQPMAVPTPPAVPVVVADLLAALGLVGLALLPSAVRGRTGDRAQSRG